MQETLTRIGARLEKLELWIGTVLMIVFTLTVLADVVFRVANMPVDWLEDLTRFIFMWTVYIGISIGFRRGTHYRIELLPAKTPQIIIRVLSVFAYVCQLIFVYVLLVYGMQFALLTKDRLAMPSEFPVIYQSISIPVSAVFMLYYLVEGARQAFYGKAPGSTLATE